MFIKKFLSCILSRKYNKFYVGIRNFHESQITVTNSISLTELKRVLRLHNVTFIEGHACIITNCPICSANSTASITKGSKIYINKITGYFICDKCKHSGSWNILEKFISIKKSQKLLSEFDNLKKSLFILKDYSEEWKKLKTSCQNLSELSTDLYEKILTQFSFKNIAQEDVSALNCLYEDTTNTLYFPLVAFERYLVGYKCLNSNFTESTIPASDVSGCIIYKQRNMRSDSTAIVVPTIMDMLALIAEKAAGTVVCLPYNLQYLPQQVLPSLENFKKLILWFGNDSLSWNTARYFARKLNEKRCYFVRPIDVQPNPKTAFDMRYDLKSILQSAQPIWHKSITTFQNLRQDVLSDLQNVDKVQGVKWKRYPSLNRILKGHRRGEFTVLTGPTGCGKTTFMSEYSLDLAIQGVNTLWGSFEIRNARLARTMLQQMVGFPLSDNLEQFDVYADKFEKLPIFFMTFHGQQNIKVVMDAVEHATYIHDIAHVIIDNVQFMMGMSEEPKYMDRFWKQDKIISAFRNFATKYDCHVTLVIHPRKERNDEELTTSSIFGSAKASQEADNVLIIQDKRLVSIKGKKYLQIAKNRYSGDIGIMPLDFNKEGLSYAMKKKSTLESDEPVSKSKKKLNILKDEQ